VVKQLLRGRRGHGMSVCSMNRRDERQQARRGEAEEERERERERERESEREMGKLHG